MSTFWNTHVKISFLPSSSKDLIKLQFLEGREAGYEFLLGAFARTNIKIFSAFRTKPFAILLAEGFEGDF